MKRPVPLSATGAVAVIADLLPGPCTEATILERMQEWQRLVV